MKQAWINNRIEEMEDKAQIFRLPEYDMDGCRFVAVQNEDFEQRQDDAYMFSLSDRLLVKNDCEPKSYWVIT